MIFRGYVEKIDGYVAFVTLKDTLGNEYEGEFPAQDLLNNGIREHRHFNYWRLLSGQMFMSPVLDEEEISDERLAEILSMIEKLGGDDDPQDDFGKEPNP